MESLFIRGGRSDYIMDEDEDMIEQLFPNSSLITIADAGHLVHIEAKDTFNQLLGDFL